MIAWWCACESAYKGEAEVEQADGRAFDNGENGETAEGRVCVCVLCLRARRFLSKKAITLSFWSVRVVHAAAEGRTLA